LPLLYPKVSYKPYFHLILGIFIISPLDFFNDPVIVEKYIVQFSCVCMVSDVSPAIDR
jgi:hypothetical protein